MTPDIRQRTFRLLTVLALSIVLFYPAFASPCLTEVVEETALDQLVTGNNTFAFNLYHELSKESGNLFHSPYSISLALAMTYAGARNETEQQMANTLHFTVDQEHLHPAFNALCLELATRGEGAQGQDGEGFRLNIANSIWGQTGYSFLPQFLHVLAENYDAGVRLLDFYNTPEDSRIFINNWVSEQTEEKIKDLLPEGVISSLTRLVLTNAIYFNAGWEAPFQEGHTQDGAFYLLDGGQVTVPMMSQTKYFSYTECENYQAVELLYDGSELSMVILLPREGQFGEFERSMTVDQLNVILDALRPRNIQLKLPKFSYESSSIRLKNILAEMGMPVAFTQDADFSGMDGTNSLLISDVIHKAFISVDEAGTEAAAATAVVISVTCAPTLPLKVNVDRPFVFLIRDIQTGAVLFMGRLVDPTTGS